MKYLCLLFFMFTSASSAFAVDETSTVESFEDYVKIRYMPSRMEHFDNKKPMTELKSKALTVIAKRDHSILGTHESIKQIYHRAKRLHDKGFASNQRFFHVSFKTIEVSYMGDIISLDYVGPSHTEELAQYEQEWLSLYALVYQYLTQDLMIK